MDFLEGKKTYILALIAAVIAGLQAYGIDIPEYVLTFLAAAGLYTVRGAISSGK